MKLPNITIIEKSLSPGGFDLLIDGQRVPCVRDYSINSKAGCLPTVTITLLADSVDCKIGPLSVPVPRN